MYVTNDVSVAAMAANDLRLRLLCVHVQLEEVADWEDEIDDIVQNFEAETGRRPLYDICFY